jgi:hypothetical protein
LVKKRLAGRGYALPAFCMEIIIVNLNDLILIGLICLSP